MRPSVLAVALALASSLAACGRDDDRGPDRSPDRPPVPRGEPKRFATKSADPVVAAIQRSIEERGIDVTSEGWRLRVPEPAWTSFPLGRRWFWRLDTDLGTLRARLLPESAPKHVASTIHLTELGFYDGLTFHRVVRGFMAQGGDPVGDGSGGPDYKFDGEFDPDLRHDRRGLFSTANAGPRTDGSQFFVLFGPATTLDRKHTIFAELKDGADVLDRIEATAGPGDGPPRRRVEIRRATIEVD